MMRPKFTFVVSSLLGIFVLSACAAPPTEPEGITIEEAWVRPAFFEGGTGAAYMQITNNADTDDVLLSASTEFAEIAELHETRTMSMEDGDMSNMDHEGMDMDHEGMDDMAMMAPVEDISVPAGETVALEVGGLHVMLINIEDIPEIGDSVPVTLTFEEAGEIIIMAEVREEAP